MTTTSNLSELITSFSSSGASPLPLFVVMIFTAMLPLALMACTSMLKLSVVFAILRSALGAGQIPSAPVATLLSIVLTWYIMTPVAGDVLKNLDARVSAHQKSQPINVIEDGLQVLEPLQKFMDQHITERERLFFLQLSATGAEQRPLSFSETVPAFALSQLREALLIGCAIFLPFLVIDLVVANLLVGLGMVMVSPMQISLPLKLLLFTLCDGWLLLSRSLILSYS